MSVYQKSFFKGRTHEEIKVSKRLDILRAKNSVTNVSFKLEDGRIKKQPLTDSFLNNPNGVMRSSDEIARDICAISKDIEAKEVII